MNKHNRIARLPKQEAERKEFLIHMYDQMFNDINRHILVVWQSVGVLVSPLAILALVERQIISLDIAASILVLSAAWLLANLVDSAYWYNRNLVIIANIERQFLDPEDLRRIHYYFGKHRKKTSMLTHLWVQYLLGIGVASLVLLYHFGTRVVPGFGAPVQNFELQRALPYLTSLAASLAIAHLRRRRIRAYEEFLRNSPGIEIDTKGIIYKEGHPIDE